jgi:hypothetical protein
MSDMLAFDVGMTLASWFSTVAKAVLWTSSESSHDSSQTDSSCAGKSNSPVNVACGTDRMVCPLSGVKQLAKKTFWLDAVSMASTNPVSTADRGSPGFAAFATSD